MVGCIKKKWDDKWKCLRFERGNAISLGCNWFARGENCKPSPDKKCGVIYFLSWLQRIFDVGAVLVDAFDIA